MKKYNISFIIGVLSKGGAERVISVLSNELNRRGYNVSIITIAGDNLQYELNKNINYVPIICKSKFKILRFIERLIKIRKTVNKNSTDLIISFLADVNIHTLLANMFNKKKIIVSERNDPNINPERKYIRVIRDIIYNFSDGFVFQTPDAKKYFKKKIYKLNHKSTIIPNPIKENLPITDNYKRNNKIVTACRLNPQKNLKLLIDAFYIVQNTHPHYNLLIYGEGPLREELEKYISELRLEKKVRLMGYTSSLHNEIVNSCMFVISSDYEGMSNSLMEAMAMGLPVISTDSPIGGARMLINNNNNGVLVPIKDLNALSEAMNKIIEDNDFAIKIGNNALKIRDKYNVTKIADEWERFILENILR